MANDSLQKKKRFQTLGRANGISLVIFEASFINANLNPIKLPMASSITSLLFPI